MKRRGFLKSLGVGAAAAVAIPTLMVEFGADGLTAEKISLRESFRRYQIEPFKDITMPKGVVRCILFGREYQKGSIYGDSTEVHTQFEAQIVNGELIVPGHVPPLRVMDTLLVHEGHYLSLEYRRPPIRTVITAIL